MKIYCILCPDTNLKLYTFFTEKARQAAVKLLAEDTYSLYETYLPKIKVIAYVEGGNIESVRSNANLEFTVWDQDNILDCGDPKPLGYKDWVDTYKKFPHGVY